MSTLFRTGEGTVLALCLGRSVQMKRWDFSAASVTKNAIVRGAHFRQRMIFREIWWSSVWDWDWVRLTAGAVPSAHTAASLIPPSAAEWCSFWFRRSTKTETKHCKGRSFQPFPSCCATMWRHRSAVTIYTHAGGRDSSCSLLLNRGVTTEERLPTLLFLRTRRRDILILVPIDIVCAGTPVSLISYTSLDIQLRFSSPGCLSLYSIMAVYYFTLLLFYITATPGQPSTFQCMAAVLIWIVFVSIYLNNLMIILYYFIL